MKIKSWAGTTGKAQKSSKAQKSTKSTATPSMAPTPTSVSYKYISLTNTNNNKDATHLISLQNENKVLGRHHWQGLKKHEGTKKYKINCYAIDGTNPYYGKF